MDAVFTLQCKKKHWPKFKTPFLHVESAFKFSSAPSEHKHMQLFGVTAAALGGSAGRAGHNGTRRVDI